MAPKKSSKTKEDIPLEYDKDLYGSDPKQQYVSELAVDGDDDDMGAGPTR